MEVRGEVSDDGAADDRDAAHARRPDLRDVRVRDRSVVTDLLADASRAEPANQDRRGHDGRDERRGDREEQCDHVRLPQLSRPSPSNPAATCSSPTARLALSNTVSPGFTSDRSAAAIDVGLALYTSLSTETPSTVRTSSRRQRDPVAAASPAAIASGATP